MNTLQEKLVLSSTVVRQLVDLLGGDKSAVAEAARISVRNVEKALEDPRLLGKMAYDGLLYQCRKNLGDDEVRVAQREREMKLMRLCLFLPPSSIVARVKSGSH